MLASQELNSHTGQIEVRRNSPLELISIPRLRRIKTEIPFLRWLLIKIAVGQFPVHLIMVLLSGRRLNHV